MNLSNNSFKKMAFYKKHFDIYSIVLMIVEPLTSQVAVPMGKTNRDRNLRG